MFAKTKSFIRKVTGDKRGNVLVLVGLGMIPMVGTAGLAVDAAQWVTWKRQLHSAADLGAMAGAQALVEEQTVDAAVRRALSYNTERSYTIEAIESPVTSGDFAGKTNMVRVILSTQEALPFSSMFLDAAPTIRVSAVAEGNSEVANCMIALDTTGTGIDIAGSSTVDMNCGIMSNSDLDATTSGSLTAGSLSAAGFITNSGAVSADTKINEGVYPSADPYGDKFTDPNMVCNNLAVISGVGSLSPGCYSGIKVNNNANVTLAPGTYYIGEKGMSVGGNSTLVGIGVTLVFTNTNSPFDASKIGTFNGNGTSNITLSAPTSGTYEGVIMVQDSRATPSPTNDMHLTGDSGSTFDGAVYSPSNQVTFAGNSSMNTDCLQIVSRYITFTGNTTVSNTCPAGRGGISSGGGTTIVRLRQ